MKHFLILFFLTSLAWAHEDGSFAMPFANNASCGKDPLEICLIHEYPIGTEVSLFTKDSNTVCYGKVSSHFTFSNETFDFKASKIKNENCKLAGKKYFLAIVNKKIKSFKFIVPKILSTAKSEKLGKEVFTSKRFEKYLTETETGNGFNDKQKIFYTTKDFPGAKHSVHIYNDKKINITVVSHYLQKGFSGAMLAILNKQMFPISDVCAHDVEKLMEIEGNYYFFTESSACETDHTFTEIFKVKDNKVELVLRDASWSL